MPTILLKCLIDMREALMFETREYLCLMSESSNSCFEFLTCKSMPAHLLDCHNTFIQKKILSLIDSPHPTLANSPQNCIASVIQHRLGWQKSSSRLIGSFLPTDHSSTPITEPCISRVIIFTYTTYIHCLFLLYSFTPLVVS